jgi:apolipoprotein N-acyltransferase
MKMKKQSPYLFYKIKIMNIAYFLRAFFAAFLFLIPFFKPELFFWTILFFIFPLLKNLKEYQQNKITRSKFLFSGMFFSSTVILVHLIWFWKLLGTVNSFYKYLFGILVALYFIIIMLIPFLIMIAPLKINKQKRAPLLFVCALAGAIYFLSYRSFIIFGCNEGYFLFDPTVSFITLFDDKNSLSKQIIIVSGENLTQTQPLNRLHAISSLLADILIAQQDQDHCLVIFPESTFPYNLEDYQEYLCAWTDCHENVNIIIGSHQHEDDKIFNCAYLINKGKIQSVYKKQHLVPFFEYIPSICKKWDLGTIFTKRNKSFSHPDLAQENSDIFIIEGIKYQIYICSELYQQTKKINRNKNIILIGNSFWFTCNYAKQLARLHARRFAKYHKITLIQSIKN